jgi:hypothetical protein
MVLGAGLGLLLAFAEVRLRDFGFFMGKRL